MSLRWRAAACTLAVVLAGCAGSPVATRVTPSPSPTGPSFPTCPPASVTPPSAWPREVPRDLPRPPGAVVEKAEKTSGGVTVVRFSVPTSLREGVLLIVREFPRYGYTIGRGDAEVTEADAPFQKGDLRGLVRILATEPCKTTWLLAIGSAAGSTGGAPFAPNYSPPPNASPLPFG